MMKLCGEKLERWKCYTMEAALKGRKDNKVHANALQRECEVDDYMHRKGLSMFGLPGTGRPRKSRKGDC